MKKIVFAALPLMLAASSANAATFLFSETFQNGYNNADGNPVIVTVSGSVDGNRNGNLLTDLSNISLFFNAVKVSEPLYLRAYNSGGYYDGAAILSFDGLQNNFLLSNSSDPATVFPDIALASFSGVGFENYDFGYNQTVSGSNDSFTTVLALTEVTADVPEPATWAMMVAGFGLVGGALRRRKVGISFA